MKLGSGSNVQATVRAVRYIRDEDAGFEAVVIADDPDSPSWHLEIQRSLSPDDQDRALGLDGYCLVLPSGASAYGCLQTAFVDEDVIRLEVTDSVAIELGLEQSSLTLRLELDSSQRDELVDGLLSVFDGPGPTPHLEGVLSPRIG